MPPQSWLNDPAFKLYAVCAVIVVFKMYFVAVYTSVTRHRTGTTLNREDAKLTGRQLNEVEHPDVQRVQRVHRNDLENIPAFLGLGLVAVLAGIPLLAAQLCFVGFTASRVFHSVAFLKELQPWRTLSFGVGLLCNLALMGMILLQALS
jgi:prostaglandin-E synthase 1